MKTLRLPPSIGITDFQNAEQVREVLALRPPGHPYAIQVGVMMSYKTLNGVPTREGFERVWPKPSEIASIFIDDPASLNMLHWADYQGLTRVGDLVRAIGCCGPNIKALQLDMTWPAPELCWAIENEFRLPIVLQIGTRAFDQIGNDPVRLLGRLDEYEGDIAGVLLDKSMGRRAEMDPGFLRPLVEAVRRECFGLRVTVAGGLGPDTLGLAQSLFDEFPGLSTDAQGQLRSSGSYLDPIEMPRVTEYVRKAFKLFQPALS